MSSGGAEDSRAGDHVFKLRRRLVSLGDFHISHLYTNTGVKPRKKSSSVITLKSLNNSFIKISDDDEATIWVFRLAKDDRIILELPWWSDVISRASGTELYLESTLMVIH